MDVSALSRVFATMRHGTIEPAAPEHPVIHERKVTAAGLTLFAIALAVVIGIQWGMAGLACYLPWLPFAFVLIWASTTALRFDDREKQEETHPADLPRDVLEEAGAHGGARASIGASPSSADARGPSPRT